MLSSTRAAGPDSHSRSVPPNPALQRTVLRPAAQREVTRSMSRALPTPGGNPLAIDMNTVAANALAPDFDTLGLYPGRDHLLAIEPSHRDGRRPGDLF